MGMNPEMIVMLAYDTKNNWRRFGEVAPRRDIFVAPGSRFAAPHEVVRIVYLMSCVSLSDDGAVHVPRSHSWLTGRRLGALRRINRPAFDAALLRSPS